MSIKATRPLALRLQGLDKSYGDLRALKKLDLEIPRGKIVGFLGVNGAGKSTTLKLIAGLLRPDRGEIEIDGVDARRAPLEAKKRLGYIPDRPYLPERLSVLEYLLFTARLYALPEDQARHAAAHWLARFSLTTHQGKRVDALSHGMRQRLVMASVFLHAPRLLLVDEPMVGLDPHGARQLKEVFRQERAEREMSILVSTHTLSVAEELCDEVIILHQGAVLARGGVAALVKAAGLSTERGPGQLEAAFLKLTGLSAAEAASQLQSAPR